MHRQVMAIRLLLAALAAVAGIALAQPAAAASAYCPNPAHARPEPVPEQLLPRLAKAFQIDIAAVRGAGFVRCVGRTLFGCYVGANLHCGKADTRRALPGAAAWCRQHPRSAGIPMSATGHATIYDWSCRGDSAVPGKPVFAVDPQGYIADNWKEMH